MPEAKKSGSETIAFHQAMFAGAMNDIIRTEGRSATAGRMTESFLLGICSVCTAVAAGIAKNDFSSLGELRDFLSEMGSESKEACINACSENAKREAQESN